MVNIIPGGESLKAFPLESGTRMPALATTVQQGERNRNRRPPNWKEVKLFPFTDDMSLYVENLKSLTTRKPFELMNKFNKVKGCKISMQQSVAFLYANNEQSIKEVKKTIPFLIA